MLNNSRDCLKFSLYNHLLIIHFEFVFKDYGLFVLSWSFKISSKYSSVHEIQKKERMIFTSSRQDIKSLVDLSWHLFFPKAKDIAATTDNEFQTLTVHKSHFTAGVVSACHSHRNTANFDPSSAKEIDWIKNISPYKTFMRKIDNILSVIIFFFFFSWYFCTFT